jgi:hypothetical protein
VTRLRLTSGADVQNLTIDSAEPGELWMISSAAIDQRMNNAMMLVHSELLFEFLVGAIPVLAECPAATGRQVPKTELPFTAPTAASMRGIRTAMEMPPLVEMCFIADILLGPTR